MSTQLMTPSSDLLSLLRRLRARRKALALSQSRVAEAMGWSLSKVIRVENGQSGISTKDLRSLLAFYGIERPSEVEEILAIARASRRPPWWSEYAALVPRDFARQLGYESSAARLSQFHGQAVPGLLQTPDYARAMLQVFADPEDVELGVRLRGRRADEVFGRQDPPTTRFVVTEGVLHTEVGGPRVLHGQLGHLLHLMDRGVGVEVVPFSAGAHPGMIGDFEIVSFDEEGWDLVSVESPQGFVLVDDESVIRDYHEIFDGIRAAAVSGPGARALIERLRKNLGG